MNKIGREISELNGAVLSSQLGLNNGVIKGENRKRKVSETQGEEKKETEKRAPVKYIHETSRF